MSLLPNAARTDILAANEAQPVEPLLIGQTHALAGVCDAHALSAVRPADVASGMERQADAAGRAAPVGPIAQSRALAELDPSTPLRWRRHLRARLTADGETLVVRTPEITTRLPMAARPATERLIAGEVLTAGELLTAGDLGSDGPPGLDPLEIARTLLRDALVVPG